jgi:hypothetical protein
MADTKARQNKQLGGPVGYTAIAGDIKMAGESSSRCHSPATFMAANAASTDEYELGVCDAKTATTCGTVAGEGGWQRSAELGGKFVKPR